MTMCSFRTLLSIILTLLIIKIIRMIDFYFMDFRGAKHKTLKV
jgi:hypothetical protein